jgi:uncharacterized protein YecE (DUF72 family)
MKPIILLGTSGWGYDEWIGPFYPKSLHKEDFLVYYSELFYTTEINTTFYNIPSIRSVNNWIKRTPSNFLFSVKIPKIITHNHKLCLDKCSESLNFFLDVFSPMHKSGKLLSYLIQLPPSFKKEDHFGVLREFIRNWPDSKRKNYFLVVEFRHKSWMREEVFSFLREEEITYCSVIEPTLPPRMDITNEKFAYIRFHGYGKDIWFNYLFSEKEIHKWANSIKDSVYGADKIGVYFNNHFSGYAVKNSLMMMDELGILPKKRKEEINILNVKKRSGSYPKGQISLNAFLKSGKT